MMVLYSIIKKIVTKVNLGVVNLEIYGMVLYYLIIRILKCIEALFLRQRPEVLCKLKRTDIDNFSSPPGQPLNGNDKPNVTTETFRRPNKAFIF